MNILVLVSNYSTPQKVSMTFVHTRNINYKKFDNINVDVLSFRAEKSYVLDEILVFTYDDYQAKLADKKYDLLISHAPNVRQHLRFINKYGDRFPKIIFFFHGHEILRRNEAYPRPYAYRIKDILIRTIIQIPYDTFKLMVMRNAIERLKNKIHLVFVSDGLKKSFVKNVLRIGNEKFIENISSVIHNVAGEVFCLEEYDPSLEKIGDFITIRSNLDSSTYAMDLIIKLAEANPKNTFHILGKGDFFNHYQVPSNLSYELISLGHNEIINVLNQYKYALMPTRNDSQGVMSCEMAMFGIPLITSDIDICHEILDDMNNVLFISNKNTNINLSEIINQFDLSKNNKHITKFSLCETVGKEVSLFQRLVCVVKENEV